MGLNSQDFRRPRFAFERERFVGNQTDSAPSFVGQDLSERDFSGSDLRFADFRGCKLEGVSFERCDLRGADFRTLYKSSLDSQTAKSIDWSHPTYGRMETISTVCDHTNFRQAKLDYAFIEGHLKASTFDQSSMRGIILDGSGWGCSFRNVDARRSWFHYQGDGLNASDGAFDDSNVELRAIGNVLEVPVEGTVRTIDQRIDLRNSSFRGSMCLFSLTSAFLNGCDFRDSRVSFSRFTRTSLVSCLLDNSSFPDTEFVHTDFSGSTGFADLSRSHFTDCRLPDGTLANTGGLPPSFFAQYGYLLGP